MSSAKKEFIAEAEDLLEESGRLILEIQDTYQTELNPDTINALFRAIHTLKGLSGLFGHQGIADLSHALESLLDEIRLGKVDISEDVVKFLFNNIDILRSIMEGLNQDKEQDVSGHLKNIEVFRNSLTSRTKGPELKGLIDEALLMVLSEYEEHRLKTNIHEGKGVYLAKAVFSLADFDKSLEELTKLIKSKGELISTLPTSSNMPPDSIGFNLMFGSAQPIEKLRDEIGLDIDSLITPKAVEIVPQPQKVQEATLKSTTTTVRVDIEKLDRILNTIGELTLAKGAVKRIGEELIENYGHSPLVIDVHKISQTLEKRLAELQNQVLEIRMVPIGQIFSRLAQVIRKYSREIGKKIELVMYGEDTEIDKYIAEEVIDPLMHLVRNALDHGIEPSEERKRKGKKESGTIILKASQRGNHVIIEVKDDGGGIDIQRVREKAIERGLLASDAELDEKGIIDFIFTPGFSTKEVVSEVSGRGVGMDVVKEKLAAIGGFAEIDTEKDKGTTMLLTIPITLAIVKSLLIRVGDRKFAMPLTSISETVVITRNELQTVEGKEVYNLRGEMLPMTNIGKVFAIGESESEKFFAVVVGAGNRKHGLIVDELFGQHEIVIKSLGEYFAGLRGFAGAAEIGKHEVILVIDVDALIEESVIKQKIKGGAVNV
ncbi:MAG: chemotaxis protein CheA [Thermodesulfovibrionales bacterium]|nr:chemotaxis protein CheA [Thermodesulfovibrionales bacterium]